jgi:hypothetical protein
MWIMLLEISRRYMPVINTQQLLKLIGLYRTGTIRRAVREQFAQRANQAVIVFSEHGSPNGQESARSHRSTARLLIKG